MGSDAECVAQSAAIGPSPLAAEEASTVSSSLSTAAAAAAAAVAGVGAGRGSAASTVETGVVSGTEERDEGRERSLAPAAESDASIGGRADVAKSGAAAGCASPSHRRRGLSSPTRGDVVNAKQETSTAKAGSTLRDTASPCGQRGSEGARTGVRVLRSSPRSHPKPGQQASSAPCSEAAAGGGGECVSPKAPSSVERSRPRSLRSRRGGSRGYGDAISSHEASKDGGSAGKGVVAGTPPQQSAATKRGTRSSPLSCGSSTPKDGCVTAVLDKGRSGLRKASAGVGSPAATAADTPATSVLSNPSSQTDRSKRSSGSSSSSSSSSRKKARCSSESPACTQPQGVAFSPSTSRRAGKNHRRPGSGSGSGCKGETVGPAVCADVVRKNLRASHGGGVEACSSTIVSGGSGTSPSARADGMGTAVQKRSPTRSAPRVAGGKPECVSAISPSSDAKKEEDRLEKRRKWQLKLLEDSPDFHGGGASPAGSTSRVRTCDARGRSVTTGGSGGRRCWRGHRDVDGSATKTGSGSGKARRADNPSAPPGGIREEEWRVKKKRKGRSEDEAAGSPLTDSGSPRESGAHTVGVVGAKTEQGTERAHGGSTSARSRRRRGCASPADVPREGERLGAARMSAGSGGDKGSGTRSRDGGTRSRSKRRTPSTAGRMGLETTGDSSADSGDSSAEGASPQSSPLSSGRNRGVPRSLGSRFAEDHGDNTAPAARRKHGAVGASIESGPPRKRARATLPRSPGRICT